MENDFVKSSDSEKKETVIVDPSRLTFSEQTVGKSYSYCTRWGIAGRSCCAITPLSGFREIIIEKMC